MPNCPLADECPSFSERIEGMGCQHYGDRGGAEWCNHYNQPIRDLKQQPVKPGEEVVVEVTDIHESGAGVGRTEDGFILLVDGALPEARVRAKVTRVRSNHAKAESVEKLPMPEDEAEAEAQADAGGAGAGTGGADDGVGANGAGAGDDEGDVAGASSDEATDEGSETDDEQDDSRTERERLGSRENFWGGD